MTSAKDRSAFATEAYLRAKSVWRGVPAHLQRKRSGREPGGSAFGRGRDPRALSDVLTVISGDMGWSADLERARLIAEWDEFAGASTAEHTTIVGITNDVLHVQCDSTTWATELRRLRGEIFSRILNEYPDVDLKDIRFLAPGAPTWRHGPRTVRGRGPRDTYG